MDGNFTQVPQDVVENGVSSFGGMSAMESFGEFLESDAEETDLNQ